MNETLESYRIMIRKNYKVLEDYEQVILRYDEVLSTKA